jgi:hypothetical protein
MTDPTTATEFVARLFEYDYCDECGGDAEHHEVLTDFPFGGTFFARCRFPAADDGSQHPVVTAFRAGNNPDAIPVSGA